MVAGLVNVLDIHKTNEGVVLMMGTMWVCFATLYFVYNPTSVPIVAAAAAPVLGGILPITWMDFAYANWPIVIFSILFEFLLIKIFKVDKSTLNVEADFFQQKLDSLGKKDEKTRKMGTCIISDIVCVYNWKPLAWFGYKLWIHFICSPRTVSWN